jgi:hypothetical protein
MAVKNNDYRLAEFLLTMGWASKEELKAAVAKARTQKTNLSQVILKDLQITPELLQMYQRKFWQFNKPMLGQLLVTTVNGLKPIQVRNAVSTQVEEDKKIGEILIARGLITEEDLAGALAKQLDLECYTSVDDIQQSVVYRLPTKVINQFRVMPVMQLESSYVLGMVNPMDLAALDKASFYLGGSITRAVITDKIIRKIVPHGLVV